MDEMKYQASVDGSKELVIRSKDLAQLDIVSEGAQHFHILHEGQSFRCEVLAQDFAQKIFTIRVNGRTHEVKLSNQYDQLIQQLGLNVVADKKIRDVKAPMPGLVLEIAVAAGQAVEKGDKLLILEAMKMENIIKSEGIGTIKAIRIEKGAAVDKGQLLIEME